MHSLTIPLYKSEDHRKRIADAPFGGRERGTACRRMDRSRSTSAFCSLPDCHRGRSSGFVDREERPCHACTVSSAGNVLIER